MTLGLIREYGRELRISHDGRPLVSYVYRPPEPRMESPRPYFHPLYTLGGDEVGLYRPHDHVWHKGIAFSLPNIIDPAGGTTANFWGGPTYLRGQGYAQLPNNGVQQHLEFDEIAVTAGEVRVIESLDWITEPGETWFAERRSFTVVLNDTGSWTLVYGSELTNVSGRDLAIGSPTTEGRDNAGYGGLFWRGPRSFSSAGHVYLPDRQSSDVDELMGSRAEWLAFTGRHDSHGRQSTLVFVDGPDNVGSPTPWFVRRQIFACVCPAPFFSAEVPVPAGETLTLRYAVTIVDGDPGADGVADVAKQALAAWR